MILYTDHKSISFVKTNVMINRLVDLNKIQLKLQNEPQVPYSHITPRTKLNTNKNLSLNVQRKQVRSPVWTNSARRVSRFQLLPP